MEHLAASRCPISTVAAVVGWRTSFPAIAVALVYLERAVQGFTLHADSPGLDEYGNLCVYRTFRGADVRANRGLDSLLAGGSLCAFLRLHLAFFARRARVVPYCGGFMGAFRTDPCGVALGPRAAIRLVDRSAFGAGIFGERNLSIADTGSVAGVDGLDAIDVGNLGAAQAERVGLAGLLLFGGDPGSLERDLVALLVHGLDGRRR